MEERLEMKQRSNDQEIHSPDHGKARKRRNFQKAGIFEGGGVIMVRR